MIWIDLLAKELLLNTVCGTLVFGVWQILDKRLKEACDVPMAYAMLKITVLCYLLPVAQLFLVAEKLWGTGNGRFYLNSGITGRILRGVCLVWAAGALWKLAGLCRWRWKCRVIRRHSVPLGPLRQEFLWECCQRLGMRPERVRLRFSSAIVAPLVHGFWRPCIYFPLVCTMSVSEREAALLHELNHLRSRDSRWRYLAELVVCFQWFNPWARRLPGRMEEQSEACCDYRSGKAFGNMQAYFSLVYGQEARTAREALVKTSPEAGRENQTVLEKRLKLVKRCQNAQKRGRCFSAAWAGVFLFLGTIFAWAGTVGTVQAYEQVYCRTVDLKELKAHSQSVPLEMGDSEPFAWLLKAGGFGCTKPFYQQAESRVQIAAAVEPAGARVQLGIACPDGKALYLWLSGSSQFTFPVGKDGYYRIYTANEGTEAVQVSISYAQENA